MRLVRSLILGIIVAMLVLGETPSTLVRAGSTSLTGGSAVQQPNLTAWTLIDMRRADQPDLFVEEKGIFHLRSDWQAARLDYVYKWWGLADPVFDAQTVTRVGTTYQRNGKAVDSALVTAFLHALTNLHPTQFLLVGQGHTDDYPSWMLEITGMDDQRIQLYSASTANPGSAPWNVIYNGRLYAQYDGSLAGSLGRLFSSDEGVPAATFDPGTTIPGVAFATSGWLAQLTSGFVGLLPIAEGFRYEADPNGHAIRGVIEGRSSIGGFGHMVIGTITKLTKVQVTPNGKPIDCAIKEIPSSDPSAANWEFTCDGLQIVTGQEYDFPIAVTFGTDQGATISTEGRLQGVWHEDDAVLMVPLPAELQAALSANPVAADIMTDHVPIHAYYLASIDADKTSSGIMSGEIVLLGQVTLPSGILRYTVGTPFAVKDGKLTVWTLSRQAVQQTVTAITNLALTKRIIKALPDVILNLWYTETSDVPEAANLINAYPPSYGLTVQACGTLPKLSMPTEKPLQAFSFNGRWDFWLPDFVLADGEAVIYDLTLYPNSDPPHALTELLLPTQLAGMGFRAVRATHSSYRRQLPEIQFALPENASAAEEQRLRKLVDALPVKVDVEQWFAPASTFKVMEDGTLTLFDCASR
ncbi:MAG: hypothetical protein KF716_03600 [Anaerolineae bacterium]|nr:hypothetical protein [Anaerolineae bacterium]